MNVINSIFMFYASVKVYGKISSNYDSPRMAFDCKKVARTVSEYNEFVNFIHRTILKSFDDLVDFIRTTNSYKHE